MLCPYTCQGMVAMEAMQIVQDIVCALRTKYRARIVMTTEGSVTIHTLTKDEGDRCLREIEDTINSNLIVTKITPVSHFQAQYLEAKEKLKQVADRNMVTFSLLKDQCNNCKISLKGTVNGVDAVMAQLKCYMDKETSFGTCIPTRYVRMWFKRWQQLKEAQQDVMLQFGQTQSDQTGITFVTFYLWGDTKCVDALKNFILTRDSGDCIRQKPLQGGASIIAKGLENSEIDFGKLAVELDINEASNTVTIVAPIEVSDDDIKKAREIIQSYLENQKAVFPLSDPIMGLILASPKYSTKLSDITHLHNVKVILPKFPNSDLTLIGNPAAIQNVVKDLQQLQMLMYKDVDQIIMLIDPKHVPVIKSSKLQRLFNTIQDKLFVSCSHRTTKANITLENRLIQPTPLSHCIKFELVQGSLVYENVCAIVNNANECLQHTDGIAKLVADAGGPSIQSDCENYIKHHGKLKPTEAVCFYGGSLLCRKVIHAVWPHRPWHKHSNEEVCGTFVKILNLAEAEKIESISISNFGTDIPPKLFVKTLLKVVNDHCKAHASMSACIQKVRCILPDNGSAVDELISTLHKLPEYSQFNMPRNKGTDDEIKNISRSEDSVPQGPFSDMSSCISLKPEMSTVPASSDIWEWLDDNGLFVPYSCGISSALSSEYSKNPSGSLFHTIIGNTYLIDFTVMTQINTTTMKQRPIQCTHATTSPPSLTATQQNTIIVNSSHSIESNDCPRDDEMITILLRGFKVNLECSKTNILQMLNNATASEGSLSNSSIQTFPQEWQPQTKTTELFTLSPGSIEFHHVAQLFQHTMPQTKCTLCSIQRIQNKWLWERYHQHRKRLEVKNEGVVNEKELFHGTRTNEPRMIYEGEDGFDMRYSAQGKWGKANYFAVNANYSHSYAHVNASTGLKELFLVKVLTGESCDCVPNSSLRVPPLKSGRTGGTLQLEQLKYDTVTGSTNGSQVFMAYDNEKAYPAYLIEYKEL